MDMLSPMLRALLLIATFCSAHAFAEWQLLPQSRHQLFRSYALFSDQQTGVVYYGASRLWGVVGNNYALAGDPDRSSRPQLVTLGTINAAMVMESGGRIVTDGFDVRVGLAYEFSLNDFSRLSIYAVHYSGHVAEGAVNQALLVTNLGSDIVGGRWFYDWKKYLRAGVGLNYYFRSGPKMKTLGAQETLEYFPLTALDDRHQLTPYLAAGMEHVGVAEHGIRTVYHLQVGAYLGTHLSTQPIQSIRAVLGVYKGPDPRLKYFAYHNASDTFGYTGVMVDL